MEIILALPLEVKNEEHFLKGPSQFYKIVEMTDNPLFIKGKRNSEIAASEEIGDYTAVSQATRRFEDKIRKDNKIRIMVNSVLELLKD